MKDLPRPGEEMWVDHDDPPRIHTGPAQWPPTSGNARLRGEGG